MSRSSSGLRSELDIAAEVVEPFDETQDGVRAIAADQVIGAEAAVFDAVVEHVVGGGQHRGGDGEDGFLGAAAS
jgi:hypothetical protein